jgi:hypothetical protein
MTQRRHGLAAPDRLSVSTTWLSRADRSAADHGTAAGRRIGRIAFDRLLAMPNGQGIRDADPPACRAGGAPLGREIAGGGIRLTKAKIMITGESWTVHSIHQKGCDSFKTSEYAEAAGWLKAALEAAGWDIGYQPSHVAAREFPATAAAPGAFDCIVLGRT